MTIEAAAPLYSGLVRAHTRCHFGGYQRSAGDVFEVRDLQLFVDDPFSPCRFERFDEVPVGGPVHRVEKIARYVRIDHPVMPVSARMPADMHWHPGVRRREPGEN